MSTEWFNRRPGDFASPGSSDPSLTIIGDGAPDWVRLPEAVVFQAGGIVAWHPGDQEHQVVFLGRSAKNITPITEEYGKWIANGTAYNSLQEAVRAVAR